MSASTVVMPPVSPGRPPTAPAPDPAADPPRGRRWLLGFWLLTFVAFLIPSAGKMTFDTKLGVTTDPWKFLGDLGSLWQDGVGFGGIADQYIGYAFPMLPFYGIADLLQLPVWLAERLWLATIVTVAFWGAMRLAERLRVGTPATRLLGAAAYALWPTFTIVVGSTSAAALPGAFLPWVLLPLTSAALSPRAAAARSALIIPFMGGVNAASTLASLLPIGLYLLSRPGSQRKWTTIAWWTPGVVLATLWWTIPLLLLGAHGENFLPYIEQADTTTGTMAATETLRGAGNWVAYLNFGDAWLPAGWTMVAGVLAVAGSALAAGLGLAGLARRDMPERRWLTLTVLTVVAIMLAGYGGALGSPFHGAVQDLLDGPLTPFRNIYKFQTGLALALALGIAHFTAAAVSARRARTEAGSPQTAAGPVRSRPKLLAAVAAVLILPGLALPYLNGSVLQSGAFDDLPDHWRDTAAFLEDKSPDTRALVVPATAHGIYTWGSPIDQPLDVLAESPVAQRDYVPFGTPGQRRYLDAVEQALMSGTEVPGLREYLARAGLYYVVVRNDLDPDQIGYVPPATVKQTLERSGYEKETGFGPLETGGRIPANTPPQIQGLYTRLQAVEIYRPADPAVTKPVQAALHDASGTVRVSGGPESLLQLSAGGQLEGRPTVLTGDGHPGAEPGTQVVADGLRRNDTRFGLVNTNTSYTYTEDERNAPDSLIDPGDAPRQLLPAKGASHQTVSVLRGAKEVSASSVGSWLFHLPQYDPVNAFDGDPRTAWTEGSAGSPVGEWVRIRFDVAQDLPDTIQVTPLDGGTLRAAPTRIRVETEDGAEETSLKADGTAQPVKTPGGTASWMKLTIVRADGARPGLSGAGIAEVDVPDVRVTRVLALPNDAENAPAASNVFSLHRGTDTGGLAPAAAENGLHRQFTAAAAGTYSFSGQALAVPSDELDALLDEAAPGSRSGITVKADSTTPGGDAFGARNLVDADLTTAWIAGDKPVLHLSWEGRKEIDQVVLAAAGGLSTRPTQVQISTPSGTMTAGVDRNGLARFEPVTTDRLDITVSETAELTLHNPLVGERLQLPVGLSEVYVPALADLRAKPVQPDAEFSLPCGDGPVVAVDGTWHATSATGKVRDLVERRPVDISLCDAEDQLELSAGRHVVESGDAGPLAVTDVTLTSGDAAAAPEGSRTMEVGDWGSDERRVEVGAGAASYLQVHENFNEGWKAELDGRELTSLRLDGWQQAFLVPEGEGGTVTLSYEPAGTYTWGLIGAIVGLVALGVLALLPGARGRGRGRTPEESELPQPPPGVGFVLGVAAVTVVLVLVSGPVALVALALVPVALLRPKLLPYIALAAMAAAGAVAVWGAGDPVLSGQGAFSHAAQLLALIALAAAVVSVDRQRERNSEAEPE